MTYRRVPASFPSWPPLTKLSFQQVTDYIRLNNLPLHRAVQELRNGGCRLDAAWHSYRGERSS